MIRQSLSVLLLVFCSLGCDGASSSPEVPNEFQLLDAMIQIQISYDAIEPNLRAVSELEATSSEAEQILAWSDDPTFDSFVESDQFYSTPAPFMALRDEMRASAQMIVDGASNEDIDGVRQGFIELKMSCTGCHKRYSPGY